MTVRLRAHHLLCILTYVGEGYSAEFIANYDGIAARIAAGGDVQIVEGPDDICGPLLATSNRHCTRASALLRDRLAATDLGKLLGRRLFPDERLKLVDKTLSRLRSAFASGAIRQACTGCRWSRLCDSVAAAGFRQARIGGRAGSGL